MKDQQALIPYKDTFKELATSDSITLTGNTILIPSSLHSKAVQRAHEGHQGLEKTKQYARGHIWLLDIDRKLTIAVGGRLPYQAVTNARQQNPFKMGELPN